MRQLGGQRVLPRQDSEDTAVSLWTERKPKSKKMGKGGLGTRRLECDFPDCLLAVSDTWKRCAVVWSFCILVGDCAICTIGAKLNITWLALTRCCHAYITVLSHRVEWRDLSHASTVLVVKSAWACYMPNNILVVLAHVQLKSFYRLSTRVEKMYHALSCLTVLKATGSWARAWKEG